METNKINIKDLATKYMETPRIPKVLFSPSLKAMVDVAIKEAFIQGANTLAVALQLEVERLHSMKEIQENIETKNE